MFEQKLYGLSKGGKFKEWNISVWNASNQSAVITITFGEEGGKMQRKDEAVKVGKQGRSVYEQAVSQAEARVKKQLDKNYRPTKEELKELPILAMLAKDHTKAGKVETVEEGVFVSDKLDGVRCLAKCISPGVVTLESRTGQPYSVPKIEAELAQIMNPGEILDGELYTHGPSLQEITSAVKRVDAEKKYKTAFDKYEKAELAGKLTDQIRENLTDTLNIMTIRDCLEFRVFDIVEFETPFIERLAALNEYAGERFVIGGCVVKVPYHYAESIEDLTVLLKDAISRGYEGIMYRTHDGEYESGKRSSGLWKFKLFLDEEFYILHHHTDKNGYAVFDLQNNLNDEVFSCVLGDYGWRTEVGKLDAFHYSGQYMTVQFQARYKGSLLPQFPTGKVIREGNVINGEFVPDI